jgi:hypothetical protein
MISPGTRPTLQHVWKGLFPAIITIIGLVNSRNATAQPVNTPCCTTFDDKSLHGWGACPPPQNNVGISIKSPGPSGAASDYYFHATDKSGGSLICAGGGCNGDWGRVASTGCATFCFDVRLDVDGDSGHLETIHPSFTIKSGALGAVFKATILMTEPGGSNPGWHHICAPIQLSSNGTLPSNSDGSWMMTPSGTNADWNTLLSNVTAIQFPVDFTANPAEEVSLDNLCLSAGDCLPLCSLCGEITAACCLGTDSAGHQIYSFLAPVTYQSFSTPSANCHPIITSPTGSILAFSPAVLSPGLNYISGTVAFAGPVPSPFCLKISCGQSGESCVTPVCVKLLPACDGRSK